MLKIRLLYFAVLRDITGVSDEVIELAEGSSAGDAWQWLRERHGDLRAYLHPPMIAVNESYAGADEILREGDELAFIPPVAGG